MEETTTPSSSPSIMSIGLKFGLILGLISITQSLVVFAVGSNPFENNWVNSVIGVAITIGVVILAQRAFKAGGDGFMSYGQGLGLAMVVSLVGILVGMIFSYIYLNFIDPSAFEAIWDKAAEDMAAKGTPEEQIEMGLTWGRKLFWLFYLLGGAFWSLVIGLIVTIFTQKKAPESKF